MKNIFFAGISGKTDACKQRQIDLTTNRAQPANGECAGDFVRVFRVVRGSIDFLR